MSKLRATSGVDLQIDSADRGVRPGTPDLGAFPRSAWLAAARRALAVAADDTLGYGDPRGLPVLREALAAYLPGWDERNVIANAARHDLALEGLGHFAHPGHHHPPALVIGYATPPDHAYTAALARLGAVLSC